MEINGRKINDFLLERPIFRGYVELSASVKKIFRCLLALKRPEKLPYLFHFCNDDIGACSGFKATFSSTSPYEFTLERWSHRKVTKTPVPILSGTFFREISSLSTTFLLAPLKTTMAMEDPPFESMHFLSNQNGRFFIVILSVFLVCVCVWSFLFSMDLANHQIHDDFGSNSHHLRRKVAPVAPVHSAASPVATWKKWPQGVLGCWLVLFVVFLRFASQVVGKNKQKIHTWWWKMVIYHGCNP